MRDNARIHEFMMQLLAAKVHAQCAWETRRDGRKGKPDVAFYVFKGEGFSPSISTAIVVDYDSNGFGLFVESGDAKISRDVAAIAAPRLPYGESFLPSDLFNCCTDGKEPDWTQFESLFVGGCIAGEGPGEGETHVDGSRPAVAAEFFTVYGRRPAPDGSCEAITDIADARRAFSVAGELARRSRLPVTVDSSL